jgi:hydroxymethylglutaryl-CoA lyase
MGVDESLEALARVAQMGLEGGRRLRGYVVTAFGCPYEGRIDPGRVVRIVRAYADMGATEVSLGDTTGMANPRQVEAVFRTVIEAAGGMAVAAHFHNSRGAGLANALAAYQAGVRVFDASVGGIGGCPTAIGAMGNIATEDLVNMMEEMGISTGVDLTALLQAARFAREVIGSDLPSYLLKSGRPEWEGPGEG